MGLVSSMSSSLLTPKSIRDDEMDCGFRGRMKRAIEPVWGIRIEWMSWREKSAMNQRWIWNEHFSMW